MEKIFVVVTVASEIGGLAVLVKVNKAFKSASDAENFINKDKKSWREVIQINNNSIDCFCEKGIQEVDLI
jgi:hypothetical protein